MNALPFTFLAAICYWAAASYQGLVLTRHAPARQELVQWLALGALIAHASALGWHVFTPDHQWLFSFFNTASLINWFAVCLLLLASLRRPLLNLGIGLFPLAGLAVIGAQWQYAVPSLPKGISTGVGIHILTSLFAYSVLTLASVQALLLWLQDHQLKHKQMRGLIQVLPPLQTMERLLFELLLLGVGFLTLALVSGALSIEAFFAQHLAHKSLFSLLAWFIFTSLLIGRYRFGWRGQRAVRWTLGGSVLLVLAYFGSKFVLEFVLAS